MERRRFTAVLVVVIEHRPVINIIVLQRDELAFAGGAEPDSLLSVRAMTDRLEHHLAAEHEFDWLAKLPRRSGRERTMRPRP